MTEPDAAAVPKFSHGRGRFWWTGLVLAVLVVVRCVVVSYPTSLVEVTVGLVFVVVLVTPPRPRGTP
jgi:hypothetical protein